MNFKKEYNTLVISGNWNHAIINPDWISKFVLPNTKMNVEIPLNVNGSFRISTDELRIFSIESKLFFSILKHDDEIYKKIGELGIKIAEYLIHTPVSAFGINFVFECVGNDKIDELLSINDTETIRGNGYLISSTHIKRELKFGEKLINLGVVKSAENYTIDLNYHNIIKSLVEFKDKFEPNYMVNYKNESIELLNNLYGLKMD